MERMHTARKSDCHLLDAYLEVRVGIGVRQPSGAWVLLVLERPTEHLGNSA